MAGPTGGAGPTGSAGPGTVTSGWGAAGQPIVTGVNQPGGTPIPPTAIQPPQGVQKPPKNYDEVPPSTPPATSTPGPNLLQQYLAMLGHQPAAAQNYSSVFQNALGSARSDIGQQLAGALSDIKANQLYAHQALGQLPGQINQSYNTANSLMNTGQQAAQQGMNAPGLNATTAANTGGSLAQYMAPERAAIAGEKAGEQANVPLLATGITQASSQEQAAANNAALSDYSALAQQQAQLAGQAQIAAMNGQNSLAQQQAQNQYGLLSGSLNNQYTLGQIKASNANTAANSPVMGGGTSGVPLGMTQGMFNAATSTPQYKGALAGITTGQITTKADLLNAVGGNIGAYQILVANYGSSLK